MAQLENKIGVPCPPLGALNQIWYIFSRGPLTSMAMLHAFIIALYYMEIANVSCGKITYNANVYE